MENYQNILVEYMKKNYEKGGILLYHSNLSHYINTSLFLSLIIYANFPNHNIHIITNPIGITSYLNTIKQLNLDYKIFTFNNHYNFEQNIKQNSNYTKDKIIILDKSHYYKKQNKMTNLVVNALHKSFYNILISSNPFVNSIDDFTSTLAILRRISISESRILLKKIINNEELFKKVLSGYISYHQPTASELSKIGLKQYNNNIKIEMDNDNYIKHYIPIETKYLTKLVDKKSSKKSNIRTSKKVLETRKYHKIFDLPLFFTDFKKDLEKHGYTSYEKMDYIINKITTEDDNNNIIYFNTYESAEPFIKLLSTGCSFKWSVLRENIDNINYNKLIHLFNNSPGKKLIILAGYKRDRPLFIKQVDNLYIYEPQIDNEIVLSIVDSIILSSSKIYKKSSKRRLDIFTFLVEKPYKNIPILEKLKNFLAFNKVKSIDYWINQYFIAQKQKYRIFISKIKKFSIEKSLLRSS